MEDLDRTILHDEHLLLSAHFAEASDGRQAPLRYVGIDDQHAFDEGVALVDLSGMGSRLISGEVAPSLMRTVFAGHDLTIGDTWPQVALTGDGSIAGLALVARTGDGEYAFWELTGRGDILTAWVAFVAGIEQRGIRPFAGTEIEDASTALVPLLLWGPQATAVLRDYTGTQDLPERGTIRNIMLDRIACLVGTVPLDDHPCYLVLVPPQAARILWRSFLSFQVVMPVGMEGLINRVTKLYPFMAVSLEGDGRLLAPRKQLIDAGVMRIEQDFIGARGLGGAQ
ncbi:MAG: hypothetical protein Q4G41_02355 [Coriobacteriales bacterium]|nr:hypothetical protein [Coriobacteriales bacterium]